MKRMLAACLALLMLLTSTSAWALDETPVYDDSTPVIQSIDLSAASEAENVASPSENVGEAQAADAETEAALADAYETFCDYVADERIPVDISFETFCEGYYWQPEDYETVNDYLLLCIDELSFITLREDDVDTAEDGVAPLANTSSDDETWFYNTANRVYQKPNYSKYNLLNKVQAGDIIYEAAGGSHITGHAAIVEGLYYSSYYGQYYIRIIEAIGYSSGNGEGDGICRSILDDDRIDSREGSVLRVSSATSEQKAAAIAFCVGQIGKDYQCVSGGHHTSENTKEWYCSELVWAAYYNQGIDLESSRGTWIFPNELRDSSKTTTIALTEIAPPTISSITPNSSSSVTVSWNSVSSATKYYVYRATSASGSYTSVGTTTSTSYTDTGLSSGTTYYYRVAAYNGSAKSGRSVVKAVRTSFGKPVITAMYTPTSTSISLHWSTVRNATGYYVYRSTSESGTYTKVATTSARTYRDSSLTSGTTYYYKIVAYNSSETSSYSSAKGITPVVIDRPTIYYSRADSTTSLTIKWSNVPCATSYHVYRATSASGTYTNIGNTTKTSFTDSGLSSGVTYYYKVKAVGNSTAGKYSNYHAQSTN